MEINIRIVTAGAVANDDGEMLIRLGQAMLGDEPIKPGISPAIAEMKIRPPKAAAETTRTKTEKPADAAAAVSAQAPTASTPADAPATAAAGSAPASAPEPAATGASTSSSPSDAPVTEADIVAAANAAAGKIGAAGPAKIRDYIKANFKKADGTEGTLKTTAPDQQPRLLADLQKIARGELTL